MDQSAVQTQVSEDLFLGGRLRLRQPAQGYRAGLDAALLAAACDAAGGQRVLEAGCGVGAALLAAAARRPDAVFTGMERDPSALSLARENIVANGLADRVNAVGGDVARGFRALGLAAFDAVLANPPFFDDARRLRGPHPTRRDAYLTREGLPAWVDFLLQASREGGTITIIHRADRLGDILAALAPRAGSVRVRPVQPFADEPAKRVLVRAIKTGKAPLVLLPALVLHDRSEAKHAEETEAILRGEAALAWS
jgi:tRNA1(Val) A37 N6-methylase TrmN6